VRALLVIATVVMGAAACSEICGDGAWACMSNGAVVVRVVDADTKAPITDATVLASSGDSVAREVGDCPFNFEVPDGSDAGPSNCRAISAPGKYHLTVRAPGYLDAVLDVEAQKDLCGHLTGQIREVGLQELGSAAKPLVDASEGCGG